MLGTKNDTAIVRGGHTLGSRQPKNLDPQEFDKTIRFWAGTLDTIAILKDDIR